MCRSGCGPGRGHPGQADQGNDDPIVIGASNIVSDVLNLVKLEEAGAAAIVYKSLFEEQIQMESLHLDQMQESYSDWDAEHTTLGIVIAFCCRAGMIGCNYK